MNAIKDFDNNISGFKYILLPFILHCMFDHLSNISVIVKTYRQRKPKTSPVNQRSLSDYLTLDPK